jgi:hypothetical protein
LRSPRSRANNVCSSALASLTRQQRPFSCARFARVPTPSSICTRFARASVSAPSQSEPSDVAGWAPTISPPRLTLSHLRPSGGRSSRSCSKLQG